MMAKKRKYTGFDRVADGYLAGTERFKNMVLFLHGGKLKNYGSFQVRKINGSDQMSVHATGRAIDFGYTNREDGLAFVDFLVRNAEAFGIEAIHDYKFGAWGRAWRCDRNDWKVYTKKTIGRGGNWIHVELSPAVAKDAGYVDAVFQCLLSPLPPSQILPK
jgi:hypothetical protein